MREMVEGVDQDIREGTPLRRARQTRKRFGHVNGSTGESLDVSTHGGRADRHRLPQGQRLNQITAS
jgi:hypothetical protein